jgi:hypothetical protein
VVCEYVAIIQVQSIRDYDGKIVWHGSGSTGELIPYCNQLVGFFEERVEQGTLEFYVNALARRVAALFLAVRQVLTL